jgi:pimeloyl-ACP methyl ester carboxylesterase
MRITFYFAGLAIALGAASASCSEDTPEPLAQPSNDGGGADSGGATLDTPTVPCSDPADSVYGAPGPLAVDQGARGNIIKCAKEPDLAKDAIQAKLTALGAPAGKPLTSGAHVYKVSYRTERGDTASTPAVSSALVYIPDTPRGAKIPVVIAARATRGQAAKCAVSKLDPSIEDLNDDALGMVYPLVGYGYAVIFPDLAGYANFGAAGNPPSAYAQAADVGRSTLDGGRALKKLFPALDDKVVLVGHSQGGHSALASLALAESYGTAGPVVGAAVFAPLWLSQRSWGAILLSGVGKDYPLAKGGAPVISVLYHYTQAELLDGPGAGRKMFVAEKQDAVEAFVKNECYGSNGLAAAGTFAHEIFDPTFVADIAYPAALGSECSSETCTRWIGRYSADRPHLTGAAATTPIFLAYGMKDTTIPPNRMRCAVDRLKQDNANLTTCVEADRNHNDILAARGEHVANWIASLTLGGAAPPACAANEAALTEDCASPPPND